MAIVELDKDASRRARRGDRALIAGLAVAIGTFMFAMWLSAPHPASQPVVAPRPSAAPQAEPITATVWSRDPSFALTNATAGAALAVIGTVLSLPPGVDNVDLFQLPERLTNENLSATLRNVVRIRGGAGLASVEGPAVITWTENGLQYWMISPTTSTADLITIADGLKDSGFRVTPFAIGRKVNIR